MVQTPLFWDTRSLDFGVLPIDKFFQELVFFDDFWWKYLIIFDDFLHASMWKWWKLMKYLMIFWNSENHHFWWFSENHHFWWNSENHHFWWFYENHHFWWNENHHFWWNSENHHFWWFSWKWKLMKIFDHFLSANLRFWSFFDQPIWICDENIWCFLMKNIWSFLMKIFDHFWWFLHASMWKWWKFFDENIWSFFW